MMVIVAESDENYRDWLCTALHELDNPFVVAEDFSDLMTQLQRHGESIVLLDDMFHEKGPLATLGLIHLYGYSPKVVLLSNQNSPQLEMTADRMEFHSQIRRASSLDDLKGSLAAAFRSTRSCYGPEMLGNSSPIKELRDIIDHVADSDASVMIVGESGTGKELVAQAVHNCSQRATQDFVPVNMAALPDSLVESVLFGHEKGAFTGADSRQAGLCQHADRGTLFLDEIGEMSRELQPKLLRFLQSQTVQRVGAARIEKVDTRIISATNRTIEELVQHGVLREDLFFRLHVIPIHVPALRDRRDDIPLLANAFLARKQGARKQPLSFSPECLDLFYDYSWPGNIRQLENMVERMSVMAKDDVIEATEFKRECSCLAGVSKNGYASNGNGNSHSAELEQFGERVLTRMESAERRAIIDALDQMAGNVSEAAAFLGVGTATMYRKIRTLEIPKPGQA